MLDKKRVEVKKAVSRARSRLHILVALSAEKGSFDFL